MRRVFSPDTPDLRLLPVSDPDAGGHPLGGQIIRTAIYGRAVLTVAAYSHCRGRSAICG